LLNNFRRTITTLASSLIEITLLFEYKSITPYSLILKPSFQLCV